MSHNILCVKTIIVVNSADSELYGVFFTQVFTWG